jgi:hypothetical protein
MPIQPITASNKELFQDLSGSNLKATAASGASTISIYSISQFAVNKILLLGEFGEEDSEIVKTHASTAPSGNTVTLASALTKDHPKDTPVYILDYDQMEISWASTTTGAKTVLDTVSIDPERLDTVYRDSDHTSGYFFFRFKNSITSVYSSYSDPTPYDGWDPNTVGYAINQALAETGKELSDKLTYSLLFEKLNMMLRYVRGKLKKWNNFQNFDEIIAQTSRGVNKWAMPSDVYDPNSLKSILSVRIGNGRPLRYIDKKEFDLRMEGVKHTTVATQPSVGATSLVLNNTYDLPDDGTIHIYYNNTLYEIEYTTNTRSTGTLSGIPASGDGSITVAFAAGTDVWMDESEGAITEFTIYGGYIYSPMLPGTDYYNKNVYLDYYTDMVSIDSDGDVLQGPRYDMAIYWLKAWIRAITENNGKLEDNDPDMAFFSSILNDAIRKEISGQKFKTRPRLNGIFYNGRGRVRDFTTE